MQGLIQALLFNLRASSMTPYSKISPCSFSLLPPPSCHHSHSCSPHFLSPLFPSALLCFIPTSPLWLHFNPLILITHFVVSRRFPHILSARLFLLFPAPVSQVSACLFPPQRTLCFLRTFSSFPAPPLFAPLGGFSLSPGTHDPFSGYRFHFPVSLVSLSSPLIPCLSAQ